MFYVYISLFIYISLTTILNIIQSIMFCTWWGHNTYFINIPSPCLRFFFWHSSIFHYFKYKLSNTLRYCLKSCELLRVSFSLLSWVFITKSIREKICWNYVILKRRVRDRAYSTKKKSGREYLEYEEVLNIDSCTLSREWSKKSKWKNI